MNRWSIFFHLSYSPKEGLTVHFNVKPRPDADVRPLRAVPKH